MIRRPDANRMMVEAFGPDNSTVLSYAQPSSMLNNPDLGVGELDVQRPGARQPVVSFHNTR